MGSVEATGIGGVEEEGEAGSHPGTLPRVRKQHRI